MKADERNDRDIGALLLLANEFFQFDQMQNPVQAEAPDLLISFLPVWDIYNPRDLAYAVSRIFHILTEILPGSDADVRKLASKLGMNIGSIRVGSLSMNDFIDFGQEVVVFEIKSSLLTEGAKRGGNKANFIADYTRKFVRNAKGKPKALAQLAAACKALESGRIATTTKPALIYPVCISNEPAVESFFFTSYSNELFQSEIVGASSIQPVTMMSVNELEEVLPYVASNAFTWADLLDFRFPPSERSLFCASGNL